MKKRIWELDFFRGVFLWGMIGIHLIYDLVDLYGVLDWQLPEAYLLFKNRFGITFVVLSGLCATLGRNSVRRRTADACHEPCANESSEASYAG